MHTSERHDLADRLYALGALVRLVRQHRMQQHPGWPAGMISILTRIDQLSGPAPRLHAKELAATSALDPSTVSRAVAALVAQGLVERRADPADRRASILVLTDAGRRTLAEARGWHDDLLRDALARWHPDEVRALVGALGRLTEDVKGAIGSSEKTLEHIPMSERSEARR